MQILLAISLTVLIFRGKPYVQDYIENYIASKVESYYNNPKAFWKDLLYLVAILLLSVLMKTVVLNEDFMYDFFISTETNSNGSVFNEVFLNGGMERFISMGNILLTTSQMITIPMIVARGYIVLSIKLGWREV